MKTYTEEDMKAAYDAGSMREYSWKSFPEWLESYKTAPEPEEVLSFPLWFIKEKCGWVKWCDIVQGGNYSVRMGYDFNDKNELFYCTESQARKLGLI